MAGPLAQGAQAAHQQQHAGAAAAAATTAAGVVLPRKQTAFKAWQPVHSSASAGGLPENGGGCALPAAPSAPEGSKGSTVKVEVGAPDHQDVKAEASQTLLVPQLEQQPKERNSQPAADEHGGGGGNGDGAVRQLAVASHASLLLPERSASPPAKRICIEPQASAPGVI